MNITKNQYSIIIDIDNTLVDTSIRKQKILETAFESKLQLSDIKKDYYLDKAFGNKESEMYKRFINILNSEEGIQENTAELFENANTILERLKIEGYNIILLSARPSKLLKATKKELELLDVNLDGIQIYLNDSEVTDVDDGETFKTKKLLELLKTDRILVLIGDRVADMNAALTNKMPSILFNNYETLSKAYDNPAGFFLATSWVDIYNTIKTIYSGNEQIEVLRLKMIDQYASWLSDIDNKARLNVTISLGLLGLTGTLIKQELPFLNVETILTSTSILIAFSLALFSLLYSLKAITSRHTSGSSAKRTIKTTLFNSINILWPIFFKRYQYIDENDPLKLYEDLKNKSEFEKRNAHITYFQETFHTYDKDALLNLRLFALKATNYAKVYPERISNYLLSLSITFIAIWLIAPYLINLFTWIWKMIFGG